MFTTKKRSDVVLNMSNHGCIRTVITMLFRDILTNSKLSVWIEKTILIYVVFSLLSSLTLSAIVFLSVGCIHKRRDKNDSKSKTTI